MPAYLVTGDLTTTIQELEDEMLAAAENLQFERAALLRDQIKELKRMMDGGRPVKEVKAQPASDRKKARPGHA
jgi:excinuclease ABC subunit B